LRPGGNKQTDRVTDGHSTMCGAVADWGQDPMPKLVSCNHTVTVQERLFPQVIEQFAWSHLKARQAAVDPSP